MAQLSFVKKIHQRAESPKAPSGSGRSSKWDKLTFDDLVFVPAQLEKRPIDYFRQEIEKINSQTVVGKRSKKPFTIEIPIVVAAMSFGALSERAKLAIAKASPKIASETRSFLYSFRCRQRIFRPLFTFLYYQHI